MRYKLLYLIPFLAALNGVNIQFYGLNIRLDQAMALFLILLVGLIILIGKKYLYLDLPGKLLILFIVWSFIATLLNAPDLNYSLIQTINIASAASIYFVLTNLLNTQDRIDKYIKYFLLSGILATGYGTIIFILSFVGFNVYGVNLTKDINIAYGVFATMREPNIFGSYSLVYFIITSSILISLRKRRDKSNSLVFMAFITSASGIFISFTRAVWLAALIGLVILSIFLSRVFEKNKMKLVVYIVLFGLIIYFAASFIEFKSIILYKITHLFDYKAGTGAGRISIWQNAVQSYLHKPFVGNGTYSFASMYPPTLINGQAHYAWIGNFLLTLLHDTGIIGTFIFLTMIMVLLKKGFQNAKKLKFLRPFDSATIFGLCLSLICLLIAYIFTTGFSFVYSWSVLGLIGVYIRLAKCPESLSKPPEYKFIAVNH